MRRVIAQCSYLGARICRKVAGLWMGVAARLMAVWLRDTMRRAGMTREQIEESMRYYYLGVEIGKRATVVMSSPSDTGVQAALRAGGWDSREAPKA